MKMIDYIENFANHLKGALEIAKNSKLQKSNKRFNSVLIVGLGGSGIGGTIVKDIVASRCDVPVLSTKKL